MVDEKRASRSLVKLLRSARVSVVCVLGCRYSEVLRKPKVLKALEEAIRNEVSFEVIASGGLVGCAPEFYAQLRRHARMLLVPKEWPAYFFVADSKAVLLDEIETHRELPRKLWFSRHADKSAKDLMRSFDILARELGTSGQAQALVVGGEESD